MAVCLRILNGCASISPFNLAHVVLIPKVDGLRKVSDYRPISLCSVLYKTITKVLANRLNVISPPLYPMSIVLLFLGALSWIMSLLLLKRCTPYVDGRVEK